MDYHRLPFPTVQLLYDRISLLEWFAKHGEATDSELGELVRLNNLTTERVRETRVCPNKRMSQEGVYT